MPAIGSQLEARRSPDSLRTLQRECVSWIRDSLKNLWAIWGKWQYLTVQEAYRRDPVRTVSRLLAWRTRCLLRWPAIASLPRWHVKMFLPAQWRGVAKLIFTFREYYEPELAWLEKALSPGSIFVDAGANIGIYTVAASRIVGDTGRVIAFEPSTQSFPILRRNIALNGLKNVLAFPFALGQTTGQCRLFRGPNPGLNSLGKDPSWEEEVEEIEMEQLDRVLDRTSTSRVDVIKMDVQGAEELVLRGARRIVTSMRPLIIFEIFPEGTAPVGLSPFGAWEFLQSLDYKFFLVQRGTLCSITSPPAGGNVVAIPRQQR
jgi:FkbM family methyltransferase